MPPHPIFHFTLFFFASQGDFLAVASHDNFVDIYDVQSSKRVGVCSGASSYITHVDWEAGGQLLMVNSGAREMLFFEMPKGKRVALSEDAAAKMVWGTRTCVLGKVLQGIWPPGSDITDINACALTASGKFLATGDDFGFVKLFSYPVLGERAKFKKYLGHSAHVTNVRFTAGDHFLASTGGADTAVMLWAFGAKSVAPTPKGAAPVVAPQAGQSDDSDTDGEEDGYDSDVEHEKQINYAAKAYAASGRDVKGVRPSSSAESGAGAEVAAVSRVSAKTRSAEQRRTGRVSALALEYVHGYRGFDSRDSLRYTSAGHVVYPAAGVGVVLHPATNKQTFYLEHTDDIISLALNPNPKYGTLVATGQIGNLPSINVWDASTLQVGGSNVF